MSFWNGRLRYIISLGLTILAFNFYFIFLMQTKDITYLLYLDGLIAGLLGLVIWGDVRKFRRWKREKEKWLSTEEIICRQDMTGEALIQEDLEIAKHDVELLESKLNEMFDENCQLQDYVARWCHEVKLPLAASLLINEKIRDVDTRKKMREQLEKINQQVSGMLLGCRLQGTLFDMQVKTTMLNQCVRSSIKNNQFFLIQKGFTLQVEVESIPVDTDPSWLIYVLDQFLQNSIKYTNEQPMLHIWSKEEETVVRLFIEDNGEGIREEEKKRIFEKGFTGNNHHNGQYKSTGMGLYMVARVLEHLGHKIIVESEFGVYTRIQLVFEKENLYK